MMKYLSFAILLLNLAEIAIGVKMKSYNSEIELAQLEVSNEGNLFI